MDSGHHSRTIASTVLVITLVAALAACQPSTGSPAGSPAPASPVATASGSASVDSDAVGAAGEAVGGAIGGMSPAPSVDVAALFLEAMRDPFRTNATIKGELTVESATYSVAGSSTIDGSSNHQVLTFEGPGVSDRAETMNLEGVKYSNRDGLWFETPREKSASGVGTDFSSVLRSVLDVTDTGMETRAGQSLHHLKPRQSTPIPIAAIGMADPGGDGTLAFDFYTRDDGTPVVMALNAAWTEVNGSSRKPLRMTLEFTFTNVGGPVVIQRPAQVWVTFTSKRFKYTIAHPSDWEAEQGTGRKKPDVLLGADLTGMYVYRFPTGGLSLNNATSTYIDNLKRSRTKAKVTSNTATTVDGTRARRLEWTNVYKGTRGWFIEVVVVRGKYVYFFQYTTLEKPTKADRDLVDDFQKSVTLPSKAAGTSGSTRSS
jgi:hypothetical protein